MTELHPDEQQLLALLFTPEGIAAAQRVRIDPNLVDDDDARATLEYVYEHLEKFDAAPSPTEVMEGAGWDEIPVEPDDVSLEVIQHRLIRRRARKRLRRAATKAAELHDPLEGAQLLNAETAKILADSAVSNGNGAASSFRMDEFVADYFAHREALDDDGPSFGFDQIDRAYGSPQIGELYIVAGNSGRFKSWMLMRSAVETWLRGHNVYFWTGELTVREQSDRFLAMVAGVPWDQYRHRGGEALTPQDHQLLEETGHWIREQPNEFRIGGMDDGIHVPALAQIAVDMDAAIMYADQLYNLEPTIESGGEQWLRRGQVARELKLASRHLPIMAAAQLNRDGENLKSWGSLTSGYIGDSYTIVQIADIVFALMATKDMQANHTFYYGAIKNRAFEPKVWEALATLNRNSNFEVVGEAEW